MDFKENLKEIAVILLASLILSLSISFKKTEILYVSMVSFLIILSTNALTKKIVGNMFEIDVKTTFWKWYRFGFRRDSHFKKPVPMAWLPIILSLFTRGSVWWLAILEFEAVAKTERVSKKHGLYRFSEVTEWHMGLIAMWGIITNIVLAIIGYAAGQELFAKIAIYYSVWSILPISSLDGTKILFAGRALWLTMAIISVMLISVMFLGWGLII